MDHYDHMTHCQKDLFTCFFYESVIRSLNQRHLSKLQQLLNIKKHMKYDDANANEKIPIQTNGKIKDMDKNNCLKQWKCLWQYRVSYKSVLYFAIKKRALLGIP